MNFRRLFQRLIASRFASRCLFLLLLAALFTGGLQLRWLTWEKTTHLRFQHDIVNGFYWGSRILEEGRRLSPAEEANSWPAFLRGYLALYDRVKRETPGSDYRLDYPPLRLLVMSIWAKQVQKQFPGVEDGKPEYVEPLLRLNLFCEVISALAIFLLARLWVNRASGATGSRFMHWVSLQHRGWICGLAAAIAAWLDPSMILDAHGWPQWDVWILPFYLFAALAASTKRWFWCGCLLAFGAMLKGQLLFVAPFFVMWPLWQKKWTRALRLLAGFATAMALLVSPWLLRNPEAWIVVAVVGGVIAISLFRPRVPHASAAFAGIIAVAFFAAGALTGGSFAWLQIGFLYGSEHYPYLFISSCYNLPSLLSDLGWSLKDPFWSRDFGPLHIAFTLQWTLRLLYLGALALCARGAARHARNRDPRLLIALAAPWLLMFALLGQMHERYLLWGGVVSALALGVSIRMSAISFILSAASTAMIAHVMLMDKKLDATLPVIAVLDRARPFASWVVLSCAAFYFWEVLSTRVPMFQRWKRSREPISLSLDRAAEEAG
jgi:hypothetical protein